jgi:soluble lytic murein transglycosylase-like protein
MDIDTLIQEAASKKKIPYDLLKKQINTESKFNPMAVGDQGRSRGLMQIQKNTATSILKVKSSDLNKLFDPKFNIDKGTDYLNYIIADLKPYLPKSYDDYWASVFMAYNSGPDYMKRSLQRLKTKGNSNPSIQQIVNEMITPDFGRKPKLSMTINYIKSIIPNLKVSAPFEIGTFTLIISGLIIFFVWKKYKEIASDLAAP